MSDEAFIELAMLRVQQGFSAIQLVVGIPPEVGPQHPDAASMFGPAWNLQGEFNREDLRLAVRRTALLNELGLRVIIYGAWGHQIKWLGRENMVHWWQELVNHFDDLDVIYCLTGESNLWIGQENILLPDRSTGDLWQTQAGHGPWAKLASHVKNRLRRFQPVRHRGNNYRLQQRRQYWSTVLEALANMSDQPLIIHTKARETGYQAVENPELLSANTTQTGHNETMRNALWQIPLGELNRDPKQVFINLEPWYEGINDKFYVQDLLFSYWVTMLAGAASYCYGAHGIWNVGDGRFLAYWGRQTFSEAMELKSPALLGLSHQQFLSHQGLGTTIYKQHKGKLLHIARKGNGQSICFYPDVAGVDDLANGQIWLPLHGRFVHTLPQSGPVVFFGS